MKIESASKSSPPFELTLYSNSDFCWCYLWPLFCFECVTSLHDTDTNATTLTTIIVRCEALSCKRPQACKSSKHSANKQRRSLGLCRYVKLYWFQRTRLHFFCHNFDFYLFVELFCFCNSSPAVLVVCMWALFGSASAVVLSKSKCVCSLVWRWAFTTYNSYMSELRVRS